MAVPRDMSRVEQLHEKWERAVERGRSSDVITALVELEKLEPREALWSHRLGDALRRAGKGHDAVEAFVRAMDRYRASGFLPRAIAMAKLVETLEPHRGPLVTKLAPSTERPPPPPAPLERADDEALDEVRFSDAPARSSIEIVLEDVDIEIIEDVQAAPPPPPAPDNVRAFVGSRLFIGLPHAALVALANAAQLIEFTRGDTVMTRDEPAISLFVIVEGQARVELDPPVRLSVGDVFGESCLLEEGKRLADVRAETTLTTLCIAKRDLDAIVAAHSAVDAKLFECLARRLVSLLINTSPLFTVFEAAERLELARMFEARAAARGLVLAERGKRIDGLYIVLAGTIVAEGPDGPVRIPRGSTFGQGSLLGHAPSQLTVRAETEAVVLRLPASRFATLAVTYPPVLAHLADVSDETMSSFLHQ